MNVNVEKSHLGCGGMRRVRIQILGDVDITVTYIYIYTCIKYGKQYKFVI